MLRITETISTSQISKWDRFAEGYGREKVAMFDLETTGLSPQSAFIYIIGINLFTENGWQIIQLFNDDGKSEPEMIREFMSLLEGKTTLFHFNGDRFDLPFVRVRMEKIRQHMGQVIPDRMSRLTSVDLLKEIRPFRLALGLPDVKQKTVERYLGIDREDQYNGGQLIDIYLSFLASGDPEQKRLVLLHNRDDMEGMFHLAGMNGLFSLVRGEFTTGSLSTKEKNGVLCLRIPLLLREPLPRELFTSARRASLQGTGTEALLELSILQGSLCCAVTKEKKEGFFLPCFDYSGVPGYTDGKARKAGYISADDKLLGDPDKLLSYARCAVSCLLKKRP